MFIPKDVKERLLLPMLAGRLTVPIFDFILEAETGDQSFSAFLSRKTKNGKFKLTLHRPGGGNISEHFSKKKLLTPDDAITATGILDGRIRVKFPSIYPPSTWGSFTSHDVSHTKADLSFTSIEIPASGLEKMTYEERNLSLAELNNMPPPQFNLTNFKYEHLAVFPESEIFYFNAQIKKVVESSFWGKWTDNEGKVLNGEIWGGNFSLRQWGDHVMVGLEINSNTKEISDENFKSLCFSVSYVLAFQPWPAYEMTQEDGRIIKNDVNAKIHHQDSMSPCGKGYFGTAQKAVVDLIRCVAEWKVNLPNKEDQTISEALWIFRSADNPNSPFPLKQAMICNVVESIFNLLNPSVHSLVPPPEFTELKKEIKRWLRGLPASYPTEQHKDHLSSLNSFMGSWKFSYRTRKQQWADTFKPLFPKNLEWVDEQWDNWNLLRHPVAHGNFSIQNSASHEPMLSLGKMAAFFNAVIAAKAGYAGPIRANIWGDDIINL